MNRKGKEGTLMGNIVYLIILVIFGVGMFLFLQSKTNGAAVLEDYYAKEIAKMIDVAQPSKGGVQLVTLDVQSASKVAVKNDVSLDEMFSFDNDKNEVCVKLSPAGKSCFSYYNDVEIENYRVKLLAPVNILSFEIRGKA